MAIESKETRIGGVTYRVSQLPAKRGRSMLVRFVRLVGPGAGSFVGGLGRSKDQSFDGGLALGIADGLHDLCLRLNDDDLSAISDEFARCTVVVKSREIELRLPDIFDEHFAARYDEMFAWLRFCCEVNFASFFAVSSSASGLLGRLTKVLSVLQPPPTSTGTSTASPAASATPTA